MLTDLDKDGSCSLSVSVLDSWLPILDKHLTELSTSTEQQHVQAMRVERLLRHLSVTLQQSFVIDDSAEDLLAENGRHVYPGGQYGKTVDDIDRPLNYARDDFASCITSEVQVETLGKEAGVFAPPPMEGGAVLNGDRHHGRNTGPLANLGANVPYSLIRAGSGHEKAGILRSMTTQVDLEPYQHPFSAKTLADDTFNFHKAVLKKVKQRTRARNEQSRQIVEQFSHLRCPQAPHSCREVAHGYCFNCFCAGMTILYAIAVGIEADVGIRYRLEGKDPPDWVGYMTFGFNAFFVCEVMFRMAVDGIMFFIDEDWRWNSFDVFLAGFSAVDIVSDGFSLGFLRLFRATKLIRAFRVVRVLKLFGELRLLVVSILTSLMSLFWSLAFLFLVTYFVCIAIIQGAVHYVSSGGASIKTLMSIREYYSNVPLGVHSLIASITGGINWIDLANSLWEMHAVYGTIFLMFVLVSVMGIMNVITAIFVENACNISSIDRDFAIMQHLKLVEGDVQETISLWQELDLEGHGQVTIDRFTDFFADERVIAYFSTLEIDVSDPSSLIGLFQHKHKHDGIVTMEDFVVGCISLRGAAKKSDVRVNSFQMAMHLAHIEDLLFKINERLEKKIHRAHTALTSTKTMNSVSVPTASI